MKSTTHKQKSRQQKCKKPKWFPTTATFYALPQEVTKDKPREIYFNTSTIQAGIDNRCTASISNDPRDFMGKLTPFTVKLKSYKGEEEVQMMKDTLQWKWKDNEGSLHTFRIPNSYYDPKGSRFLSTQHWTKELKKSGRYKDRSIYYKGDDASITLC